MDDWMDPSGCFSDISDGGRFASAAETMIYKVA
jgi:hypothetical protein